MFIFNSLQLLNGLIIPLRMETIALTLCKSMAHSMNFKKRNRSIIIRHSQIIQHKIELTEYLASRLQYPSSRGRNSSLQLQDLLAEGDSFL